MRGLLREDPETEVIEDMEFGSPYSKARRSGRNWPFLILQCKVTQSSFN